MNQERPVIRNTFPSNSAASKQPQAEQPKKITQAIVTKPTLKDKIQDGTVTNTVKNIGHFVLHDILVPNLKLAAMGALEKMFWKNGRPNSPFIRTGGSSFVNYNGIFNNLTSGARFNGSFGASPVSGSSVTHNANVSTNWDNLVLPTRPVAEEVLGMMSDILIQTGTVSVSNLYSLVGIPPTYMDERIGWVQLQGARVDTCRNGYTLRLPTPQQI